MRILLVDNYDSFVFYIVGHLQRCRRDFPRLDWHIVKNDRVDPESVGDYDAVILSPGPGVPAEAGNLLKLIEKSAGRVPVLGICLGCQAIAEVFGARLLQLETPRHGHCSRLLSVDAYDPIVGFLSGAESRVGRYHSWVIDEASLGGEVPLRVTSRDEDGNIMSIRHESLPLFGLQFHPESIITAEGNRMIRNFLGFKF